jgi:uncharacterized protein YndB with AHSA1/START domain
MAGFEVSEWIARSPEEVFRFIADTSNAPKVMQSITRMEKLTDGPVAVGTRYRETRVVNGKEAQVELEVAEYTPPRVYAMRNETNGIHTVYRYIFTAERDGTRVDLACEVTAGGLKKAMVPMVVSILKKEDGDHLARLKSAVESA